MASARPTPRRLRKRQHHAAGRRLDRHRPAQHRGCRRRHRLLAGQTPTPDLPAQSALESYSIAYWWSAAFFALGALVCGLLFRRGVPEQDPEAAPTVHM